MSLEYSGQEPFLAKYQNMIVSLHRGSLIAIKDTHAAKQHKNVYSHLFSEDAVSGMKSLIDSKLDELLHTLCNQSSDGPVDVYRSFCCFASDIIMKYVYAQDFGALESMKFQHPILEAIKALIRMAPLNACSPRVFSALDNFMIMIPNSILQHMSPNALALRRFENVRGLNIIQ